MTTGLCFVIARDDTPERYLAYNVPSEEKDEHNMSTSRADPGLGIGLPPVPPPVPSSSDVIIANVLAGAQLNQSSFCSQEYPSCKNISLPSCTIDHPCMALKHRQTECTPVKTAADASSGTRYHIGGTCVWENECDFVLFCSPQVNAMCDESRERPKAPAVEDNHSGA